MLLKGKSLNQLVTIIDKLYKPKNPLIEIADGPMIKLVISTLDNKLGSKIPEEWANPIEDILSASLNEKWELAGKKASELLNTNIDIPGIEEEAEKAIFNGAIQMIIGVILKRVNQK